MKIIKSAIALTLALSALSQAAPVLAWEDEEVLEPGESGFEDTQEYEEAAEGDEERKTDPEDNEEEDLLLTSTPEDMSADNNPEDSLNPEPAEDMDGEDAGDSDIDADTESRLLSLNQIRSLKERHSQGYEDLNFLNPIRAANSQEDTQDFLTKANFPDPYLRQAIRKQLRNPDDDSPVTKEDLERMDTLWIDDQRITDLTGLEHLKGLKQLQLYGLVLVSGISLSDFPSLETFRCSGRNIASISLSGCEKLEQFSISGNEITDLKVTDCPNITSFECTHTSVENFDFSSFHNLREVNCNYSKLKALDLSSSKETLEEVNCQSNQLTSLDIQGFPLLSTLNASGNPLNGVNLTNCSSLLIADISGWEGEEVTNCSLVLTGCQQLGSLSCNNAQLTSLDVSDCPQLMKLECRNNLIHELDLSKCPKLTSLYCGRNNLHSLDLTNNKYLISDQTHLSPQFWTLAPGQDRANLAETDPKASLNQVTQVSPALTQYDEENGVFTNIFFDNYDGLHSSYEYDCNPSRNLRMEVIFIADYTQEKPTGENDISNCRINFDRETYIYTGQPIEPKPAVYMNQTLLKENKDYILSYLDNEKVGRAYVLIKGTGIYTGHRLERFYIESSAVTPPDQPDIPKISIESATVTGIKDVYPYGTEMNDIKPVVTLDGTVLQEGKDYNLLYKASTTGDHAVAIKGINNYTGSIVKEFKIDPKPEQTKSIASARVYGVFASYQYTGYQIKPEPIVTLGSTVLKKGRDYTLSYSSNRYPGTATITIKGTGNYSGTIKETFRIVDSSDDDSYSYSDRGNVSMFRLYNPNSGEHFYTGDAAEALNTVDHGWTFEGIAWNAPKKSNTPIYRLYNRNAGDHFYTASQSERNRLKALGWKYEGIGWYAEDSNKVPVYREYNPNAIAGAHNYTTDRTEHNYLIRHGWKDEGIAWYAAK